jgi:hypothetical protein
MAHIRIFSLFTKNSGKFTNQFKLFLLLLVVSTIFPTYPAYSRQRQCNANFTFNNQSTGWIDVGDVGGFLVNKKQECLDNAKAYGRNNLRYETFGLTGQQVCDLSSQGGITVYIDTYVDGKVNSRDGSFTTTFQATCRCNPIYEGDSR